MRGKPYLKQKRLIFIGGTQDVFRYVSNHPFT
jgi:hypothetical protein